MWRYSDNLCFKSQILKCGRKQIIALTLAQSSCNMDPNKYFNGHNLWNTGGKQKFGYARKYETWKVVSDLFHHSPTLVESKSIKRKKRLLE